MSLHQETKRHSGDCTCQCGEGDTLANLNKEEYHGSFNVKTYSLLLYRDYRTHGEASPCLSETPQSAGQQLRWRTAALRDNSSDFARQEEQAVAC